MNWPAFTDDECDMLNNFIAVVRTSVGPDIVLKDVTKLFQILSNQVINNFLKFKIYASNLKQNNPRLGKFQYLWKSF